MLLVCRQRAFEPGRETAVALTRRSEELEHLLLLAQCARGDGDVRVDLGLRLRSLVRSSPALVTGAGRREQRAADRGGEQGPASQSGNGTRHAGGVGDGHSRGL